MDGHSSLIYLLLLHRQRQCIVSLAEHDRRLSLDHGGTQMSMALEAPKTGRERCTSSQRPNVGPRYSNRRSPIRRKPFHEILLCLAPGQPRTSHMFDEKLTVFSHVTAAT